MAGTQLKFYNVCIQETIGMGYLIQCKVWNTYNGVDMPLVKLTTGVGSKCTSLKYLEKADLGIDLLLLAYEDKTQT